MRPLCTALRAHHPKPGLLLSPGAIPDPSTLFVQAPEWHLPFCCLRLQVWRSGFVGGLAGSLFYIPHVSEVTGSLSCST